MGQPFPRPEPSQLDRRARPSPIGRPDSSEPRRTLCGRNGLLTRVATWSLLSATSRITLISRASPDTATRIDSTSVRGVLGSCTFAPSGGSPQGCGASTSPSSATITPRLLLRCLTRVGDQFAHSGRPTRLDERGNNVPLAQRDLDMPRQKSSGAVPASLARRAAPASWTCSSHRCPGHGWSCPRPNWEDSDRQLLGAGQQADARWWPVVSIAACL